MSPILVRPVREQLEHDRVIRLLQVKLKRKHEVVVNIGEDQSTSVKVGLMQIFPDLVLTASDRGHKLMGTVEVETSESVNHLEARAQWAHLGRARAPFHLYVPAGSVDIARRLAAENQVNVSEIWSYHSIGDQVRFTLVHRASVGETRRANAEARRVAASATQAEPARAAAASRPAPSARAGSTPRPLDSARTASRQAKPRASAPRAAKKRTASQGRRSAARTTATRKASAPNQKRK